MYFCTDTGNLYVDCINEQNVLERKLVNKDSLDNIQEQLDSHSLNKSEDNILENPTTLNFGDTFTAMTDTTVDGHTITDNITTYTLPSDRLFTTLVPTGTEISVTGTDLKSTTYLKVGRYYCSQNATAKTLKNCPTDLAFMMEVYSPLSTTIDNETTTKYVYRLRKITEYKTGVQYIQYVGSGATAGTFTYDDWYVIPRAKFTLDSSDKNDGSAAVGSATKPIYIDSDGTITACTHTLEQSVTSTSKLTDTTYERVTTTTDGLMSLDDKIKTDYTNVAYGTCSTAAATADKVVTLSGNAKWALAAGSTIHVKFSYTNTASNPTLNVNGTGSKSIFYNGAAITTSNLSYAGYENRVYNFVYDGTQYVFQGWSIDANTDKNVTQTVRTTNGAFPILLRGTSAGTSTTTTTTSFGAGITANPSTNTLSATAFTGDSVVVNNSGTDTNGLIIREVTGDEESIRLNVTSTYGAITNTNETAKGELRFIMNNLDESNNGASANANAVVIKGDANGTEVTATKFTGTLNGPIGTSDVGSTINPVYIKDGVPTAISYTIEKNVPSNAVFTDTTYSNMTGATSSAAGKSGLVPAPAAGKQSSFLCGDGTWAVPNLPVATSTALGGVKSGTDITVDSSGNVSVNNNSHNHTISNITDFPTSMKNPKVLKAGSKNYDGSAEIEITKSDLGLGDVEDKSSAEIRSELTSANVTTALGFTPLNSTLKGAVNGLAELDSTGKVPSSQLPSFVDDVIEGYFYNSKFYKESAHTNVITGESNKIYVDLSGTNKTYRWSGSTYVEISASLALGTTSSTAFRGDQGKTAYDHSQTAHAPSDAQKNQNAFSNIAVSGQTTVAADSEADTLNFVGSNVTITTDANTDTVTFSVATGSTSTAGILKLTNSTSSTSTTTAATPKSVREAYQLAEGKADANHTHTVSEISDLTATATELNYVKDVTSNIQTQLNNRVTLDTAQTITGIKTFNAPANVDKTEQITAKFKTSNGGSIIFGKEGPNSGTMIRLDQADGTPRLRFRSSATAGAMVWEQPEANAALYIDLGNSAGTGVNRISFPQDKGGTVAMTSDVNTRVAKAGDTMTGNLTAPKLIASQGLAITQTDGTAGYGISLYGTSDPPQRYGLWFGKTATYGTHGGVTSDWATYFGMNSGATTRGWVFRREDGCVASISGAGNLTLNGSAKIGNAVTMAYDSSNECLNFTF